MKTKHRNKLVRGPWVWAAGFAMATALGLLLACDSAYAQRPGYSLAFNGTSDQITLPADFGQGVNFSSISMEAWVYVESHANRPGIILSGTGRHHWEINNGFWRVRLNDLNWEGAVSAQTGTWQHVAFSYSRGEQVLRFYIDGEQVGSATGDSGTDDSFLGDPLFLGTSLEGVGDRMWHGKLAEVRLWNTVRSAADINQNMGRALSGDEGGLVAYWRLNEGSGSAIGDATGNGRDGVLEGGSWELEWLMASDLQSRVAGAGQTVTLGPVEIFEPEGALTYEWFHNGQTIPGATEASLTIANVAASDAGEYYVTINDDRDVTPIESAHVTLSVWENLPAAGVAGLLLLGAGIAGAAWSARRRHA